MSEPTTSILLTSTNPAPPAGNQNVKPQSDGASPQQSISMYPQKATASLLGVVKPDGTTITVDASGTISSVGGGGGTSYMDILSPDKPTGVIKFQKNEFVNVSAGSTQNLLNYSLSDGYVDRLFLATKNVNVGACLLNIYYNGSVSPTISIALNNFFQGMYQIGSGTCHYQDAYFTASNNGTATSLECKIPIPFTGAIKIDFVNNTGSTVQFFSMVEYQTGVTNNWTNTRVLRADTFFGTGLAANSVNTLVNYTGGAKGRLLGLWFMNDDFPGSVTPIGATLEGNIKLYIDGVGSPTIESSGTEDWFGLGYYAQQFPANYTGSGYSGTKFVGTSPGLTQGMFRFHYFDRRLFTTGLKITWNCGDTSEVSFTGTGQAFSTVFYYTES